MRALCVVPIRSACFVGKGGGGLTLIADRASGTLPHIVVVVTGTDENVGNLVADSLFHVIRRRVVRDRAGECEHLWLVLRVAEARHCAVETAEPPAFCIALGGEFLEEPSGQFCCIVTIHNCFLWLKWKEVGSFLFPAYGRSAGSVWVFVGRSARLAGKFTGPERNGGPVRSSCSRPGREVTLSERIKLWSC